MKIHTFDKEKGTVKIYAFEVKAQEIKEVKWNDLDQKFFESCAAGSVSKQLLGLSILAKRIEDNKRLNEPIIKNPKDWFLRKKEEPTSDPGGSELK